jgi:hypothetical protein
MPTPPALIAIMRHGEKPADPDLHGLAPQGWERAVRLMTALQPGALLPADAAAPDAFYVPEYNGAPHTEGHRPYETLAPLASTANTVPQGVADADHTDDLADAILDADADTLVVCWEHHALEPLLATLDEQVTITPAPPPQVQWPGNDFSTVWILQSTGPRAYAWTAVQQDGRR